MKRLLVPLFAATLAPAQTPSAATIAKQVDTHYNHLRTLRARYTERYRGMGLDRTETGTLTLRKPGQMRWAYDTPAGKLFVLDGKTALSYTPGDAEAQSVPASRLDDLRSPLRFLLGHTELNKELLGLTLAAVEGGYTLAGRPKAGSANLREVLLTVDSRGVIRSLRLIEVNGAETDFQLSQIEEDVPLPASTFHFTPPTGVTIVTAQAPL